MLRVLSFRFSHCSRRLFSTSPERVVSWSVCDFAPSSFGSSSSSSSLLSQESRSVAGELERQRRERRKEGVERHMVVANGRGGGEEVVERMWGECGMRVCADGGANWLHDLFPSLRPSHLVGDLDSIRPSVLSFLLSPDPSSLPFPSPSSSASDRVPSPSSRSSCSPRSPDRGPTRGPLSSASDPHRQQTTEVVEKEDQDSTDLHRSLVLVKKRVEERSGQEGGEDRERAVQVVVVGGLGGNFSHELGNIGVSASFSSPSFSVVLVGKENIAVVVTGKQRIRGVKGLHCGLFPISGPSTVRTRGLRWDLDGEEMRFDGLVSVSNEFLEDEIEIEMTGDTKHILFTVDFRD